MRLEKFPMDTQKCPLKLGSCKLNNPDVVRCRHNYSSVFVMDNVFLLLLFLPPVGYTSSDVIYRWNPARQVAIAEDMKLSQFDLVDCPAGNTTDRVVHDLSVQSKHSKQRVKKSSIGKEKRTQPLR